MDAEYTYMNKGISAMALGLMVALNKDRPVVWNTYQVITTSVVSYVINKKSQTLQPDRTCSSSLITKFRGPFSQGLKISSCECACASIENLESYWCMHMLKGDVTQ